MKKTNDHAGPTQVER